MCRRCHHGRFSRQLQNSARRWMFRSNGRSREPHFPSGRLPHAPDGSPASGNRRTSAMQGAPRCRRCACICTRHRGVRPGCPGASGTWKPSFPIAPRRPQPLHSTGRTSRPMPVVAKHAGRLSGVVNSAQPAQIALRTRGYQLGRPGRRFQRIQPSCRFVRRTQLRFHRLTAPPTQVCQAARVKLRFRRTTIPAVRSK